MKSKSKVRPVTAGSGLSYTQKLSLAAGSLSALYLLPTGAQGGVVHVSGSPVSLAMSAPNGTTVNWDVDGAHGPDFQLWKRFTFPLGMIYMASRMPFQAPMNGRGWVGPLANEAVVQALHPSFVVGPTLAAYWGPGQRWRTAMGGGFSGTYHLASGTGFATMGGFQAGDNYAGFRFLSGTDMLYGWALINFDLTAGIVAIKEWAYNDMPNGSIHIADTGAQQVPEPSTPALTLLGLGAAGLRAWRARKKARAEEALVA